MATSIVRRRLTTVFILCVPVLVSLSVSGQDVALQALGIEEYLARQTIGSPVLSPDGATVAFTVGTKTAWDGERITRIWLVPAAGGEMLRLTNAAASDWAPQWSPDGRRIAFLSARTSPPQVFSIAVDGGEARQVTDAEQGVDQFRWLDGGSLAYVTTEPRDPEIESREAEANGGYEVGTTATTSSLWRQSVDDVAAAERITDGSYFISAFAAAPGGGHFALVTAESSDLYQLITAGELRLIDSEGATLRIERPGRGLADPEFAPDGNRFSVVASTIGLSAADGLFVSEIDRPGVVNLTADFDPTIVASHWSGDSSLSFTSIEGTSCGVYVVSAEGGPVRTLLEPELVLFEHAGPNTDGRLVFVASRGRQDERLMVYQVGAPAAAAAALYEPAPWLEERALAVTEVIRYPSFDGTEISAVLTLPLSPHPAEGAPLLVLPHGGPDGMSLDDFSFLPQLFAQRGLLVFEPNFRGGIGQGREFYAANRGRIGDVDFRDIMAGVDFLVETGRADPSRMVVGGWSFGGTMTNWIVGHSRRFKAAVSVAGVADYVSRYGVSDVNHGEAALWEFGRLLSDDIDFFVDSSPISHLKGATTPTLLMHGVEDRRVPVGQAHEMYRVLKELGVEARLVLYPEAGHGISDPRQLRDVLRRWIGWYEAHLAQPESPVIPR
jgi:dipeptidyl aminopeptidase/acylaminoacyl peptidase